MSELDPVRWLEAHVPGFGPLVADEKATIYAFALLWSLFEDRGLDCSGSASSIRRLTQELFLTGSLDMAGLQEPLDYFKARYHEGNGVSPAFRGLRFQGPDLEGLVRSVIEGDRATDPEKAAAVLIIVYRLRNNFLHGIKWTTGGLHDQIGNFSHANAALIAILECIGGQRFTPRASRR